MRMPDKRVEVPWTANPPNEVVPIPNSPVELSHRQYYAPERDEGTLRFFKDHVAKV